MASAVKKIKIERDRFTDDGVRLFNASKPHGVVYADGYFETKYIQEYEGREVHYKGDGAPVGYQHGVPMPPSQDELLEENTALNARIRDLEDSQKRTNELLERLMAQLEKKGETPAVTADPAPAPESTYRPDLGASAKATEAPARGAQKPK
jgi:hypothetical protein